MTTLRLLIIKDIKQLLSEGRMLVMLVLTGLIMLSLPFDAFESAMFYKSQTLQIVLDYFLAYYSFVIVLFISYAAIYRVFYREKNNATLAALLATPISVRRIWLGKSLAVFLCAYIVALLFSVVFIILANYYASAPLTLPTLKSIALFFTLIPANLFLLISILGILYLIIKDEMKVRMGFFILIFAIFFFLRQGGILHEVTALVFQAILLLALGGVLAFLLKFLQNEKIILSMDK